MKPLQVEVLRRLEELEALDAEWEQLFHAAAFATPFQSSGWLIPWWRYFGNERLLWTITFRSGGKLVGLFPLFIEESPSRRQLQFVGCGISDYLGGLIARGFETDVCDQFWRALAGSREFDAYDLDQLRADCPLLQSGHLPKHAFCEAQGCLSASLPGSMDEWHGAISPNLNRDIRSAQRRAARVGGLSFECATASNLSDFLDILFRQHSARWAARGEQGVLADSAVQQFHREAVSRLLREGLLRFYVLSIAGEAAATIYGLKHGDSFYLYLNGFDPRFAKWSPGSVAIAASVEKAIDEGCRTIDFLRGREPYKFRFGAKEKPLFAARCLQIEQIN